MTVDGPWRRAAAGAGLVDGAGEIRPTIFTEMSALATRTGAINLGQGFPDEDGPAEVLAEAVAAIRRGVNQYPPGLGFPDLRLAISEHQNRFYGLTPDPDREVLVTAGATEALAATLLALVSPGDEILTFEPFYDAYGGLIGLAGGEHRTVKLRAPAFQPDHDELRAAVSDRTRVILVNNPHNPTGAVFDLATLELIVDLATKHNAIIVTDEVYEHLTFGVRHIPIATLPGAAERTVTISSGGKTFNTTGWKIGWLTARPDLVSAITTVKQFLTYVNGAPFQPATAVGLRLPDSYFSGIAAGLEAKRDILRTGLDAAGFRTSTPDGTYFIVADAAALGATDSADFCRRLPELAGVVAVPLTAFCSDPKDPEYASLVRFAFCKRDEVLHEAAARLSAITPIS
ncbi:aminotransferase class I/II-fold pyridoxal phosphate-dependent enzyme [Plantibacter sp. Mn2098]|uniref:aminotransferase class I/II-fold pyridoxal phosphate-dependent enzyme n=1 Tax=Plantibacter sp. Mn2098 TaxID=3395266 RepID=UPI003BB9AAD8